MFLLCLFLLNSTCTCNNKSNNNNNNDNSSCYYFYWCFMLWIHSFIQKMLKPSDVSSCWLASTRVFSTSAERKMSLDCPSRHFHRWFNKQMTETQERDALTHEWTFSLEDADVQTETLLPAKYGSWWNVCLFSSAFSFRQRNTNSQQEAETSTPFHFLSQTSKRSHLMSGVSVRVVQTSRPKTSLMTTTQGFVSGLLHLGVLVHRAKYSNILN